MDCLKKMFKRLFVPYILLTFKSSFEKQSVKPLIGFVKYLLTLILCFLK